jgi:ParB family chromosome partitioning protein
LLIDVNEIVVKDRIRKDFGDIDELAADINKNGLINPITVVKLNNKYRLIAGERRLRACKSLGKEEVRVNKISIEDAEQALRIEIAENENRKDFSLSERQEYMQKLIEIKKSTGANLHQAEKETAKEIGIGSRRQYYKEKFITENADEELIKQLDEEQISIHGAYQKLKKEKEELEEKKKQAEQRAESAGNMYEKIRREKEELEQKEPEVIEKVEEVEVIPETVQQRIKELEERIGNLKKYKNDIKNYKQKKNEVDKELNELLEYKRSLKEESDIAAQRAEIVQGVRGKVNKIINEKGSLEQLFKKDVELRNVDLYNINEMADSLTEISQLIYEYVNSQNKNEEGEIVDV